VAASACPGSRPHVTHDAPVCSAQRGTPHQIVQSNKSAFTVHIRTNFRSRERSNDA